MLKNPANYNRAVPLTYDQLRYAFANAVSEDEPKELCETYSVPGPGKPDLPGRVGEREPVDGGEATRRARSAARC